MSSDARTPIERLPAGEVQPPLEDQAARAAAVDPGLNVVLEASAGTGKTRVLVDRYVNLLRAGVEPLNILAITFTRKAAAEMRSRILRRLREAAAESEAGAARWRDLRDRLNEIAISTIDAFCLSLLREFPLEAGLDPGFDVADETAAPRLVEDALDRALRICRALARDDEDLALLFAQLGERRLRAGLAALLERRHVAHRALARVLASGPRDLTIADACRQGSQRLAGAFTSIPGGLDAFLACGPAGQPAFELMARDIRTLVASVGPGASPYPPAALRALLHRVEPYFFTQTGTARIRTPSMFTPFHASKAEQSRHWALVRAAAPAVGDAARALQRDLNVILSRGVRRAFGVATGEFQRTLDRHGVLDFGELLRRAVSLLSNMEEFARSRYLLEARYHHVLVDEFQDTSRAQWELVAELIRAWGEGFGPAHVHIPPSIFIVGDKKQSIYGFRDADVALLEEAAELIAGLRERSQPRQTITHSFRAVPPLLAFANDLFSAVDKSSSRPDAFRYDDRDRFPVGGAEAAPVGTEPALGMAVAGSTHECAAAVAAEIDRLLREATVRDRETGVRRRAQPGDVAILFRARESHRAFERALEARRIPAYVYKGLGFFDADEVKDIVALLRYLADPHSDLRAAALLRSRFVRLSDAGLVRLAPALARALADTSPPDGLPDLGDEDRRVLTHARTAVSGWLRLADTVPPAELLDRVLTETAYALEWRGPRLAQARENVKKIRGLVRRIQNRGYLTLGRLVEHLDRLSAGDESNAVIDAIDAVNLMTVHAAKGLEFPVVFVVGLDKGSGGQTEPIRVSVQGDPEEAVAIGDYETEFDEDAANRDVEETKRLLYVALTRARDRLYLSAQATAGTITMRRGGLGSVMPADVRGVFERAAGAAPGQDVVEWAGPGGSVHRFAVCRPPAPGPPAAQAHLSTSLGAGIPAIPGASPDLDDYAPLADPGGPSYATVTALAASPAVPRAAVAAPDADRPAAGRLVHRLFQFCGGVPLDEATLRDRALRLLGDEDRQSVMDPDRVAAAAVATYLRMRERPDVRETLDGATCLFEVPISATAEAGPEIAGHAGAAAGGLIVRGAIDCLAVRPSGDVIVIDFKTGTPRAEDERQMAIYVETTRRLFPGRAVEGRLVYASDPE